MRSIGEIRWLRRLNRRERLLVLLALAELADIATTAFGLTSGTWEANPAAASLLKAGGLLALILVKLALVPATGGALLLAYRFRRRHPSRLTHRLYLLSWTVVRICVGVLASVAAINLAMIAWVRLAGTS